MSKSLEEGLDGFYGEQTEAGNAPPPCSLVTFKPMFSRGLAVHPEQVKEAEAFTKSRGVPTEYGADGRPLIKSSRHFRDLARIQGMRHQGY